MKELPKRKQLRLKNYDYTQNGAYFITINTHQRATLLGNIVGASLSGRPGSPHLMIEKWLLELENKFPNVFIDKYIIMPNHVHFILVIQNGAGAHAGTPMLGASAGDHAEKPILEECKKASLPEMMDWFKTMTSNAYINIWNYIENNPAKWEEDHLYVQ